MRSLAILLSLSIMISGCATMRYPRSYKVEGAEFSEFKELDDDKALKVVALIYNVQSESWEDHIARRLALGEYLGLLKKRNSKYIKKSGIFNIKYNKVKISSWKDKDLLRICDFLIPKAEGYRMDSSPELSEMQNARRIVYLTAINAVVKELRRREDTRNAVSIASQVLMTALGMALSIL